MYKSVVLLVCLVLTHAQQPTGEEDEPAAVDDSLKNTELVLAYVVIRHGDRTPDLEELALSPSAVLNKDVFFPYGLKALTNEGKRRSFKVGKYLRRRYLGLISRLYITDEVSVRTTDFERTKMTALCALAGLYPPQQPQLWHPGLEWQPVPYDTAPEDEDDLNYWYNCPRYLSLRNQVYEKPDIRKRLYNYQDLFRTISKYTDTNITTPEDVFYLDNLFQALENVGVGAPQWANTLKPQIKEMTKIEYGIQFYNEELIQLATGILMQNFVQASKAAITGEPVEPKLSIFSAHENNVAAVLAAARVFRPHQPGYGAAFSLELRKNRLTNQFGIAAVYAPEPARPEKVLKISGCGNRELCDFDTFLRLVKGVLLTKEDFAKRCSDTNVGVS